MGYGMERPNPRLMFCNAKRFCCQLLGGISTRQSAKGTKWETIWKIGWYLLRLANCKAMFPQEPSIRVFRGVPYAKPPVGEARFRRLSLSLHGKAFETQRVTLCHVGKHTQRMRLSGREGSLIGVRTVST